MERLRRSAAFVQEISMVAEVEGVVVGHILLTKIAVCDGGVRYESLALVPVSVLPEYQGQGIGSALIEVAYTKARELGFESIVVLGHKDCYPRFGYKLASEFGISLPFDVPEEYVMAVELTPDALKNIKRVVEYDPAFNVKA